MLLDHTGQTDLSHKRNKHRSAYTAEYSSGEDILPLNNMDNRDEQFPATSCNGPGRNEGSRESASVRLYGMKLKY